MKNAKRQRSTIIIGISFAVFLVLIFIVPTVVNKTPQIQSRLLLTALGLERDGNELELSCVALMPINGSEGTKVQSVTIKNKAPSIGENLQQISEIYGKQAELGLCSLVVIGSSMDSASIMGELKYLLSSGSVSPGTYLVHTSSGASKILELASKLNPSTSSILSSIVQYNSPSVNISTVTLLEFVSDSSSVSKASIMPEIEISEGDDGIAPSQSTSQQGEESSKKRTSVKSQNNTILYNDGMKKLVFDAEQTIGYNLLESDSSQGMIILDNLIIQGEDLGKILCSVYNKSNWKKVYFKNGEPIAEFGVKVVLRFWDQHKIIQKWQSQNGKIDVTTPILDQFSAHVKKMIEKAISQSIQSNVDVFQIENEFYRHKTAQYKSYLSANKDNFLSKVNVKVNAEVSFK